ncbi:MAG TPA: D-2-hydroxyacid dehydrogenase [Xanthobacteraceae bacterium]|jgi:phosphoglycerate dehydrogenase-like enzyme|nr:D-2-hydroxyacid dehydrogenase [Xanthobacteraceae bacterium]
MKNLLILLGLTETVRNQYRDRMRATFPEIDITLVDHHSKAGPHIGNADMLLTFTPMLTPAVLAQAGRLQWLQTLGTGVDNIIDQPALKKDVIVTNVRGIHGPPVSEAALGTMLALARDLPRAVRAQDKRQWQRFPAQLLHNKTVGILGVGAISEALAPRCKALGMTVVGISSGPRPAPGFDRMHSREDLLAVVGEFDFFVLLSPLTPATRNSINAQVLSAMKPSAFLINLARGGVVDEPALIEALAKKTIAGAALDVFNEEPLPPDHPFWAMENVIITTHQGGFCDVYIDFALPTVEANMRAFLAGNIGGMINVVPH